MAKLNILIDGNYLLYKCVFSLYKDKALYSGLEEMLNIEFNKLMKLYNFDNRYFLSDAVVSWRKKDDNTYKANRTKDVEIDWDFVFKEFDNFKKMLNEKPNIKTINIQYAEGDDLISYITKESNKKGYSNFIVASDGDLYQLLDYSLDDNWINIMYNNKQSDENLYLPDNYKIFINYMNKNNNSINNLFDDDLDNNDFSDFIKKMTTRMKVVPKNKEECLFTKIISGDKGDNISSVYESLTTTGKVRGIGIDGAKKIYDLFKETYPEDIDFFNNTKLIERMKDIICFSKKISPDNQETVKSVIDEKLKRNFKYIVLDEKYQPDWLYKDMTSKIII